jgi:hypothetical protein
MAMKFKAVIKKDGKIVTEVLDRGQHLCSEVYKVTNAVGRQLSDEEIGPECDKVNEVQS